MAMNTAHKAMSFITETILLTWTFLVVSFALMISYLHAFVAIAIAWRKRTVSNGNREEAPRRPPIKSIVITGADSRFCSLLAEEYARRLGSEGTLSLQGRNEGELQQVKHRCESRSSGCRVNITTCDVTNKEASRSWITTLDSETPIDLLILGNALTEGALRDRMVTATKGFDVISENVMGEITSVNIDGMLNTLNPTLERMRSRGYGQIAIVSSLSALVTTSPVCAAMAWRKNLGISLRNSLSAENIHVNVILPDFADPPTTSWPFRPESIAARFLVPSPERNAAFVMRCLDANRPVIAFPLLKLLIAYSYHLVPPFTREFISKMWTHLREALGMQRKTASEIWGKMKHTTTSAAAAVHMHQ